MSDLIIEQMIIDGRRVDTAAHIEVINPATGGVMGRAPDAGADILEQAVTAARRAFPGWRTTQRAERVALMRAFAERIRAHADDLAKLFTQEQGRALTQARDEIIGGADWIVGLAGIDIPVEVVEDTAERRIEVHRDPLGVVCALVPWNFPVALACWKIGHALVTGNTLVLKPSPYTPLTTLRIAALCHDLLPPGVLNVITGGDALGPLMTAHPGFAKISFTGSSATGSKIMEAAAADLKRITLELGGNDAAIVLADVDVEAVAESLFMGAFFNSGQICAACKRLYIHDSIYDRVRDALHAVSRRLPVGDGMDERSVFGPLQNKAQYERVRALRDKARADGLTLLEGAAVPDQGYFLPLTLVDNPPDDSDVVTVEAFGPILPLLRFSDIDEVVERANASEYGLAGAVWSADVEAAVAVARRLDTGTVWINHNLLSSPLAPFAGRKHSGIGVENGLAGLLEYTQRQTLFIPKKS